MTTKVNFETMTPYEAGMKAFELEKPLWETGQILNCVEVAIRTAIIAERIRCQKLCTNTQEEFLEECSAPGYDDKANPYNNGYRDAAEDCSAAIEDADSEDIAHHDAAMASLEEARTLMGSEELEAFLEDAESDFEDAPPITIPADEEGSEDEPEVLDAAAGSDGLPVDLVDHFRNPHDPRPVKEDGENAAAADAIIFSEGDLSPGDRMTWSDWTDEEYKTEKISVDDLF